MHNYSSLQSTSFKEALRDVPSNDVPELITPEIHIKDYSLPSVNVISQLHHDSNLNKIYMANEDPQTKIINESPNYRVRNNYHEEFLGTLISKVINKKDRCKPVSHKKIKGENIILVKESNMKPLNYLMVVVGCL